MDRHRTPDPAQWGLGVSQTGALQLGTVSLAELALQYGTPLHVVHGELLDEHVRTALEAARRWYPGPATVHFAMKCNGVPGIVERIRLAGASIEVMSSLELETAVNAGYDGRQIIVNGPGKGEALLCQCIDQGVRLIIVDSLAELDRLARVATSANTVADILLRVNPDIIPEGMNAGSATGSRTASVFGLDLKGGEVDVALERLVAEPALRLRGFHLHIGTGIRQPAAYVPAVRLLADLMRHAAWLGHSPDVIDVGGGFAAPWTREFTSAEMLGYSVLGRLPRLGQPAPSLEAFIHKIAEAVREQFAAQRLPELIFEPGRSITSPVQFLLLTVTDVKRRLGIGQWLVTDGGLGTVTMPTYYEVHEILPCREPRRPRTETVTILGPGCFSGDVVYRNKRFPATRPGDVLALMDSGAYFTALESNFGHPRPGIVAVDGNTVTVLRRRETAADFFLRDCRSTGHASQRTSRSHEVTP